MHVVGAWGVNSPAMQFPPNRVSRCYCSNISTVSIKGYYTVQVHTTTVASVAADRPVTVARKRGSLHQSVKRAQHTPSRNWAVGVQDPKKSNYDSCILSPVPRRCQVQSSADYIHVYVSVGAIYRRGNFQSSSQTPLSSVDGPSFRIPNCCVPTKAGRLPRN